jgi:hypothetical protein
MEGPLMALKMALAERVNGILKEEWLNRENIKTVEQGRR